MCLRRHKDAQSYSSTQHAASSRPPSARAEEMPKIGGGTIIASSLAVIPRQP